MTPDYRFIVPKSQQSHPSTSREWYVRVEGLAYGPYDDQALWSYVQESRVTPQSEVSMRADRGFRPAQDWIEIAHWFHVQQAKPAYITPSAPAVKPQSEMPKLSIVIANIRSGRLALFAQALKSAGEMQNLTASTWLLESAYGPEEVKTVLTPTLANTDTLLVLDATNVDIASFNLGIEGETGPVPTTSGRLFNR